MMTFLKTWLKYILLAAAFTAVLSAVGAFTVQDVAEVEARTCSYTRTQFDVSISSPDSAQVEQIEGDPSVDAVFPYYALKNAFSGNAAKDVFLLMSDDMADASISLFGDGMLVAGKFDAEGAMLDLLAAEKLGVGVGDTLRFTIMGQTFSRQVCGLFHTSTYGVLTDGIALVEYSEEIAAAHQPKAYSGAFLTANSGEGVQALLNGYVGEGNVSLSYEEYVAIYCGSMLPGQTQEEFEAQCRQQYAEYREGVLASALRGGGQVTYKEDAYRLAADSVRSAQSSAQTTEWLCAISSFLLFIVLNVIFIVANRKDDRIRSGEGMSMPRMAAGYACAISAAAVVVTALTFAILAAVSSATYFIEACMSAALYFALPVLCALPVLLAFVYVYVKRSFYSNAA